MLGPGERQGPEEGLPSRASLFRAACWVRVMGSYCVEDRKFLSGVMKTFLSWIVVMVAQIYLMPLIVHIKMVKMFKMYVYFTTMLFKAEEIKTRFN